MRIRFDCYLNGRKVTAELLADKYYRKLVYKAMKPYYLAMGCCLNLVSSKMTDAIGNIVERKLYRQEVKYCGRMATEEMDRLISQIKSAIAENEVFGGDDYQYWQDVVDAMEDRFRPKIVRLQTVIKKYIEKFDVGNEDFRASICVVSAILHYMKGTVFKEVREDRLKDLQIDINDVFADADGTTVKMVGKVGRAYTPDREGHRL